MAMAAPARNPVRKLARHTHDGHSRGPLSYLDMGRPDAPAIVFIHGFGADLLTWYLCLVPLAAAVYILTSTAWTVAERFVLRRVLDPQRRGAQPSTSH